MLSQIVACFVVNVCVRCTPEYQRCGQKIGDFPHQLISTNIYNNMGYQYIGIDAEHNVQIYPKYPLNQIIPLIAQKYNQKIIKYIKPKPISTSHQTQLSLQHSTTTNQMQILAQKLLPNTQLTIPTSSTTYFTLHNIALDPHSHNASLFLIQGTHNQSQHHNYSQLLQSNSLAQPQQIEDKMILIAQLARDTGALRSINLSLSFGVGDQVRLIAYGGTLHIIGGINKYNTQNSVPSTLTHQYTLQKQQSPKQQSPSVPTPSPSSPPSEPVANDQPLRRSTRTRPTPKTPLQLNSQMGTNEKSSRQLARQARRQKEDIKNMAKYFQCDIDNQDQDDQDDSYSQENGEQQQQQSSSSSSEDDGEQESDMEIEKNGRKGRKIKIRQQKNKQQQLQTNSNVSNKQGDPITEMDSTMRTREEQHFSVPTKNPYI